MNFLMAEYSRRCNAASTDRRQFARGDDWEGAAARYVSLKALQNMKRNILFSGAALCVGLSFAQGQNTTGTDDPEMASPSPASTVSTTTTESTQRTTATDESNVPPQPAADSIVMSAGGLVTMRDGKASRLDQAFVLGNGMRITPGGTVMLKDETSITLRDGQMIDMAGNISAAPPAAVAAASAVLDAGTDGPGVSRRDAIEGVAGSAARAAAPAMSGTPFPDRPRTTTGGEVMGGHEISTDRPLANPEPSASPGSNRGLRRTGGGTR
jgi:hypothetical protein